MIFNKQLYFYLVSFFITLFFFNNFIKQEIIKNNQPNKFYPADYEMLKRTFPYYNYDKLAYKNAIVELQELKESKKLTKSNKQSLEFVGPTNIGGRVVDIEFNPQSPNIVYAAAATGGVFKSTDTGQNWHPIFDDQPVLTIGDIGVDPNNPNTIYVGTGEANGGHNNFPGFGVYKSTDAGNSWKYIGLDSSVSIGRIIVDPTNSDRVFVAAVGSYFEPNNQRGVFLSKNGGTTWEKSLFVSDSTGAIDLVIDPQNTQTLYAAMWERVRRPIYKAGTHLYGPSGGIFKTTDGGENWKKLGPETGLPNPQDSLIGRIGISISKSEPQTLYATYNNGSKIYALYKTIDGGKNWEEVNNTFPGTSNFSWYFGQVRTHPTDPNTVFVLDVSILKSTDSGISWDFSYGYAGPSHLHVDHHALAFHPDNPEYIINGNDGGINISNNGGVTWSHNVQLPITQFYEIGLDKNNPKRFYGGTQDNNTIRTLSGSIDDWESIYGGDGFYVIVHPNDTNIVYAESQFGGLGKSTDGGNSFSSALNGIDNGEPKNWSTPVVMDPNNPDILYYGTHSLYRTENAANSWNKISPKLTDHDKNRRLGTITTISVAPTNSDIVYVGTDDGYVWVTSDFGNSWENISEDLPFRWVTRVLADPNNENTVYATFSGLKWADSEARVFKSINRGKSWENISSGLPDAPINAIAVYKNNSDIIFIGNDVGAFISFNKGKNWEVLDEDFPIIIVNDMKIHPTANYLAVGTHGRGMYKYNLDKISSTHSSENILPEEIVLEQNYPNPFNPTTTIKYSIPKNTKQKASDVKLIVYNVLGKEVTTLINKKVNTGNYEVTFNASNIASGIYYYQLNVDNMKKTKKMLFLK